MIVTTAKDLAAALQVSQPRVSQLRKMDWFPAGPPWDVDVVLAAIATHSIRAPRRITEPTPVGRSDRTSDRSGSGQRERPPGPPASRSEADILTDPGSDPREVARALVRLAAGAVDRASRDGRFGPREMDAANKALSELRRTEKGFDEIAEARKELISYQDAAGACGWFIAQGLQAAERLAGTLGARVVQLSDDDAWRAKGTSDRTRDVYQLVMREWESVRATTESEIRERLVG